MAVDACPTTSQNTTKTHRNASIQHHSVHACTSIILHFVCILFAFFRLFPQSIYGTTPASETITLPLRRAPKSTYFFALVKPNEVKTCLQQGFATTKNPSRTLAKATSASLPSEIHKAIKKTKTAGEKEKNKKKKKTAQGGIYRQQFTITTSALLLVSALSIADFHASTDRSEKPRKNPTPWNRNDRAHLPTPPRFTAKLLGIRQENF